MKIPDELLPKARAFLKNQYVEAIYQRLLKFNMKYVINGDDDDIQAARG